MVEMMHTLDGLDLEVESDERENEAFKVLHQVVKAAQTFLIFALVHVYQGADLGRREGHVLVSHHDLQLLSADPVGPRPMVVVLPHDFRVFNDAFQFFHHTLVYIGFFPDHCVIFVVGVICVPQFTVWPKFELEEFVAKFSLVSHVVSQIKVARTHCREYSGSSSNTLQKEKNVANKSPPSMPILRTLFCCTVLLSCSVSFRVSTQ